MKYSDPVTPGEIIQEIAELSDYETAGDLAKAIDVSEDFIVRMYNDEEPITRDFAERFSLAVGGGEGQVNFIMRLEDIYLKKLIDREVKNMETIAKGGCHAENLYIPADDRQEF